mmetsp:Transcript_983/g.2163  ORF Transcript_983/g.2163 Transcript_983/m.2163 type:complete len:534 (-) Transcript_983:177-1778(-)
MSRGAARPLSTVNVGMPPAAAESESAEGAADAAACDAADPPAGVAASTGVKNALASVSANAFSSTPWRLRMSVSVPVTAAAAAIAGEHRCVRPPLPCRPSKLRLDVDAHRSCGSRRSGFMPRHIEHPGSRQSKPASLNTTSRPSFSACCLTRPLPGTTIAALTFAATLRPLATAAAARRSSMRAFVQLPMNTLSTGTPSSGVFGSRPMYARARSIAARRCSFVSFAGSGTTPVMGAVSCGLVPQVIVGTMSLEGITTSVSYDAPSSVARLRQYDTARSHVSPDGASGRPFRYSNVTSSGATRPARAPASMAMLHIAMRLSMDMPRTASPQNSITLPVPPAVPMMPMTCSTTSFDVTPGARGPSTSTRMFLDFFCRMVCVASTCSTSDVPMPNASAPNAPCVDVWLSPHTHIDPGSVNPCSGPMTCTMPCLASSSPKYVTPNSLTLLCSASTCVRLSSSSMNVSTFLKDVRSLVGTLWSVVASVQSFLRTARPAVRSPSNACGDVTSCTRCLSTYRSAVPSSDASTRWSSKILS